MKASTLHRIAWLGTRQHRLRLIRSEANVEVNGEEYAPLKLDDIALPRQEYEACAMLSKYEPLVAIKQNHITSLRIKRKNLKEIPEPVGRLRCLRHLDLSENAITKISNLDQLKCLYYLELPHNKIEKIEGLSHLSELGGINLGFNCIYRINCISNLDKLLVLCLDNNNIEGTYAQYPDSLEALTLDNNQIKKIEGLYDLNKLSLMSLIGNQINKIEGLDKLQNLRELALSRNKIYQIEGLDNLTQLEVLWLDYNKITHLKGLDKLSQLKELDLRGNDINYKSLSNYEAVKKLEERALVQYES